MKLIFYITKKKHFEFSFYKSPYFLHTSELFVRIYKQISWLEMSLKKVNFNKLLTVNSLLLLIQECGEVEWPISV